MRLLLRWIINAIAIYAAIQLVPGIELQSSLQDQWVAIFLLALVLGLLNALLRPLLVFLTCPLIILTLGLGTLLINTLMFYLTGVIGARFGWGLQIDGFWAAFLGALVVSIVSFLLNILFIDNGSRKRHERRS